MVHNKMAMI